jgi:hypothetical protein
MADLATNQLVNAGTAPTFVAASVSDTAAVGNGSNTFVVYKNSHATLTRTVDITVPGTTDYGAPLPDPSIVVPALGEVWIPLRREFRAVDGGGRVTITTADASNLTVAVVRVS